MQKETEQIVINGVTIYGEAARIAARITDFEWDLFDFTAEQSDQLYDLMERQGVTKAELARRMGVSKAFITKVLRGDANLNSKTFIRIVHALEGRVFLKIAPKAEASRADVKWFGWVHKAQARERHVAPLKKLIPLPCSVGTSRAQRGEEQNGFAAYQVAV